MEALYLVKKLDIKYSPDFVFEVFNPKQCFLLIGVCVLNFRSEKKALTVTTEKHLSGILSLFNKLKFCHSI